MSCIAFSLTSVSSVSSVGPTVVLLLIATVSLTIGEIEHTAGEAHTSVELAPLGHHGKSIGIFKTTMALQHAIGPALITFTLVTLGRNGWLMIGAVTCSATLWSRRIATRRFNSVTIP